MALPVARRNKVNTFIDSIRPTLQTRQNAYRAAKGRFWQGISTNDRNNPPDDTDVAPNKGRRPTDQTEDWTDMAAGFPANWPANVEVNTYSGPQGDGFTLVARVRGTGAEIWERIVNFGPETHWERDWRLVNG
jgi:hypothetical protein